MDNAIRSREDARTKSDGGNVSAAVQIKGSSHRGRMERRNDAIVASRVVYILDNRVHRADGCPASPARRWSHCHMILSIVSRPRRVFWSSLNHSYMSTVKKLIIPLSSMIILLMLTNQHEYECDKVTRKYPLS